MVAKKLNQDASVNNQLNRREFLNYAWLASIVLFSVETVGLGFWFAFPNIKPGEFGGLVPLGQADQVLPEPNQSPVPYTEGKFWLANVDVEVDGQTKKGILALYKVCTHLGCLYEWAGTRFECPCHGSKFALNGDYIEGPAPRSLDRFAIIAQSPDGSQKENYDGMPLVVNEDDVIVVDTASRIFGSKR